MGVQPELSAKWAVHSTGGAGVDAATDWFFSNMENPILFTPLPKKAKAVSTSTGGAPTYDAEAIMMITSMGLSE
jgi:hypothetical protein